MKNDIFDDKLTAYCHLGKNALYMNNKRKNVKYV